MKTVKRKSAKDANADQNGQVDENSNKISSIQRKLIFEYPALNVWEMRLYFVVWASCSAYAWYLVWATSRDYIPSRTSNAQLRPSPWPGIFGNRTKDTTNYEWRIWLPNWAACILPLFLVHSLLFNFGEKILGKLWSPCMLVFWLGSAAYMNRWSLVLLLLIQGVILFLVAKLTRNRLTIWLTGLLFLYACIQGVYFRDFPLIKDFMILRHDQYLISLISMSYKHLQYIAYCVEFAKRPEMQKLSIARNLYQMFWYSFYLPYMISLVVIYKNFPDDLKPRYSRQRDVPALVFFALRLIFWFLAIEVLQHYFYFDALMADPAKLNEVDLATLPSIGYVAGQFFQMKYVLIFGLPALFARIDKLTPPEGPICISRVALYSKMWRYFDRGLYSFFKEYIFVPICEPSFSIGRKFLALFLCYGFVLVWHGFDHSYQVWVAMNITEILLEAIGKTVYVGTPLKAWRERNISDRVFRRILVWFQIFPLCWGLYATFYFIGGAQTGWTFVNRIFWGETVTLQPPFWILITIGYFYVQSCMEVERIYGERAKLKAK